jgi:hypothetical protein
LIPGYGSSARSATGGRLLPHVVGQPKPAPAQQQPPPRSKPRKPCNGPEPNSRPASKW